MSSYRHVGCLALSFLSSTHFSNLRARERTPFGKMDSKTGKGRHWISEVHSQEEALLLILSISAIIHDALFYILKKYNAAK